MRKYLDMENSSLELNIDNYKNMISILKENSLEIIEKNFKRLILNITESELDKILFDIPKELFNEDLIVILNIFSNKKKINIKLPSNVIIVNTNYNNILNEIYIYNKIPFNKKTESLIINNINLGINIIIDPIVDVNNVTLYMSKLYSLFANIDDYDLNIGGFMVSSYMLREHPCNAYLCNGWKCKKRISMLPKHIYIDSNLNIYPHDLFFEKYLIGKVDKNSISNVLDKYFLSDNYNNFINDCKKAFINYLPKYPFDLFPLIYFIKKDVKNHE